MAHRVSPTERIRGHIDELFAQDKPLPEILEQVARLGAQLLMQAALEAELTEFPGRDRYQRAAACDEARPGSRNGYREVTEDHGRPGGPGAPEAARHQRGIRLPAVQRACDQDQRPRAGPVRAGRGGTLAEALGDQAAISKSSVSSVCQQIKDEYEAWSRRRLDGIALDYLFLDASFFRMHPGSPAEPVLAAWGITTGGKPAFIGLGPRACFKSGLSGLS